MTLTKLLIYITIAAIILTFLNNSVFRARKNWLLTFLQNWCGALFVFSGWVKAVDPLGTAYKMEQYFAEFESTFSETWFSFLAPLFPTLSEYSVSFSVFMIIFEIILGLMLILGARNKFTSWAFLLLVGFFTFLTGFTYLTGYVPEGVNFFSFGSWEAYEKTNMKVTDCGCFGDFIKLEPYTSFLKDIFLLIPSLIFVYKYKDMHQMFTPKIRTGAIVGGIAILLLYCMSNYVWDLPHTDFRPFKNGADIRAQKIAEEDAMTNAPLTYHLKNKETGEVTSLSMDDYVKRFKEFPKEQFDTETEHGEPAVKQTKISEFAIEDINNNEMTDEILSDPGYHFMYVCPKFYYTTADKKIMVPDTVSWIVDTVQVEGSEELQLVRRPDKIEQKEVTVTDYIFDESYMKRFTEVANPFAEAAQKAGIKTYAVVGGAGKDAILDFKNDTGTTYPIHAADDILLKTIIRSNPGIVLWKDGKIIRKWHVKKLPSFEEVKAEYIK